MNLSQFKALYQALSLGFDERAEVIQYPTPLVNGAAIAISEKGVERGQTLFAYTTAPQMVANFLIDNDQPFMPPERGTVNIASLGELVTMKIHNYTNKFPLNNVALDAMTESLAVDYINDALGIIATGWSQFLENTCIYGIPSVGLPGLLQGSNIPIINSTVNFTTATPEACLAEMTRIFQYVFTTSRGRFDAENICIPLDLYTVLSQKFVSSNGVYKSVWQLLTEVNTNPTPQGTATSKNISVATSFDEPKIMTLLPSNPKYISLRASDLYDVEPEVSVSETVHYGRTVGVVAIQPVSGVIVKLTY